MGAQFKTPEYEDQNWRDEALCKGLPPDQFFPNSETEQEAAARLCGGCAVRAECLEYALITNQRDGVWGGTTEKQRAKMRTKWIKSNAS